MWLAPHAAAPTQRALIAQACGQLGLQPQLTIVQPWLLRLVGLFNADAKTSIEMLYQYQQPFVVDSSFSDQVLGLVPTKTAQGLSATLDWYKSLAVS